MRIWNTISTFAKVERSLKHSPMSSEEKEVALIMQGDNLSALELGHRGEECLE